MGSEEDFYQCFDGKLGEALDAFKDRLCWHPQFESLLEVLEDKLDLCQDTKAYLVAAATLRNTSIKVSFISTYSIGQGKD